MRISELQVDKGSSFRDHTAKEQGNQSESVREAKPSENPDRIRSQAGTRGNHHSSLPEVDAGVSIFPRTTSVFEFSNDF